MMLKSRIFSYWHRFQQQIQDLLEARWNGECTIGNVAHRLDTVR